MIRTEVIQAVLEELKPYNATLVAVTKTRSIEDLQALYQLGLHIFGENRVQEMLPKREALPNDIQWHLIGHLQTNKVKYIAPFIALIHSVDSFKLLQEINKHAQKHNRTIACLLQMHIAQEETKFGMDERELFTMLESPELLELENIRIAGLMGMASNTDDMQQVRREFAGLRQTFEKLKYWLPDIHILSMGMSNDYRIALEEGSNMVRIGSKLFA
ncbi:MAG: YggS family pyridoxal phosphate-dependent enzyme [Cytophagales bacterium]|nr:YggS family pyridoxal phosphate-dependent enzyme [Bernardetiaceae bacterium]MDW8204299.1 YggS family pyridoxal phosphate-dependent enzyme [Cytophagales bacterium]